MPLRLALLIAASAALAACGRSDAPTAEENRELDRASRMLDEAPDSLNQVEDAGSGGNDSVGPGEER